MATITQQKNWEDGIKGWKRHMFFNPQDKSLVNDPSLLKKIETPFLSGKQEVGDPEKIDYRS